MPDEITTAEDMVQALEHMMKEQFIARITRDNDCLTVTFLDKTRYTIQVTAHPDPTA